MTIRESVWMFPIIEAVHLLALALIGGAVLIVDLRLAGLALKRQPVSLVATDAEPWLIGGLVVMIVTGVLLFISEALKCYYSPPFWLKMLFLALAITYTFTFRRRVVVSDRRPYRAVARQSGSDQSRSCSGVASD